MPSSGLQTERLAVIRPGAFDGDTGRGAREVDLVELQPGPDYIIEHHLTDALRLLGQLQHGR